MQHKFTKNSSNPSEQNDTKPPIENTEKENTPLRKLSKLIVYASNEEFEEKKSTYLREFMNSPLSTQPSDKKEENVQLQQLVKLIYHGSEEEFKEKKSEYIREFLNSPSISQTSDKKENNPPNSTTQMIINEDSNSSVVKVDQESLRQPKINLARAHVTEDLKQVFPNTEESPEQTQDESPKWLWETRTLETDTKTSSLRQAREFPRDSQTNSEQARETDTKTSSLRQAREFPRGSQTNSEQARETKEKNWFFNLFASQFNKNSNTTSSANKNTLKR